MRRLRISLRILCLLLCVTSVYLWARSYSQGLLIQFNVGSGAKQIGTAFIAAEGTFRLSLDYVIKPGIAPSSPSDSRIWPPEWNAVAVNPASFGLFRGEPMGNVNYRAQVSALGFSFRRWEFGPPVGPIIEHWGLGIPGWFAAVAFAAAPGLWLYRTIQRKRRAATGRCPHCGYDLRATPGQCPECGWSAAAAPAAAG